MICRIWSRQPLQKFLCRISQKKLKRRGYSKLEFCDFALWNSDCNLASSFSSKVVLSGRMERLAQRNKIKLKIAPSFQFFLRNPAQKLLQPKTAPPTKTIAYICGLGARIECEPLSEHSTRRDRVTNIGYRLSLDASV